MKTIEPQDWWVFRGPKDLADLPEPPPWRRFSAAAKAERGAEFQARHEEIALVNAALYLRRPLLVTGKPGVGKTSLAYAVAAELGLKPVLRWSVTTQTKLRDGLYRYDAIGRLQETSRCEKERLDPPPIGHFLRLGPLGSAFLDSQSQPRVLLIDELDKSDIDLPNDLLHLFEEGEFEIPELARLPQGQDAPRILTHDAPPGAALETWGIGIERGVVRCGQFPLVIMTSNAEREFPPAFLRRCLQLEMAPPDDEELIAIVKAHLFRAGTRQAAELPALETRIADLVRDFIERRDHRQQDLAADQLLNAVYLVCKHIDPERPFPDQASLLEALLRSLSN